MSLLMKPISTLDFGLIGYGDDKYRVYTFDKTGDSIELKSIEDSRTVSEAEE